MVDIVYPHEILRGFSGAEEEADENATTVTVSPTSDPAIAVPDLEGRRRLLLEPCSEEDSEEQMDGLHYRRRRGDVSSGNRSVQLLHIHYNGWPVRWDEWIRSDSERIRPFRVRTRHASSSAHASPTVATAMAEPPSTRFTTTTTTSGNSSSDDDDDDDDDDETNDRRALLPELHRAWNRVNDRLERAVAHNHHHHPSGGAAPVAVEPRDDLPWRGTAAPSTTNEITTTTTSSSSIAARRQELEELAPLLDRLGRILTDAAPHVAALAASMAEPTPPEAAAAAEDSDESESGGGGNSTSSSHPHTLGGLLSLLSRGDHRRRGRHNSHEQQSVASSNAAVPAGDVSASLASSTNEHASVTVHTEEDEEATEVGGEAAVPTRPVDPDLSDYATGFVNTTRGELRSGPRGSRSGGGSSGSDDLAGLLGAWLAAASLGGITSIGGGGGGGGGGTGEGGDDNDAAAAEGLGRLLRDRGNGGGIDIHIHAVVTAPGGGPAGGMAGLGTAGTATPPTTTNATPVTGGGLGNLFASLPPSPRRSPRRFRSSNASHTSSSLPSTHDDDDEDDMGIFAELYSENPDPVNPNRPDAEVPDSLPSQASTTTGATTTTTDTTADEVGVLPSTSTHSFRSGRSSRRRNNNDSSRGNGGGLGRFFRRSNHG